jgi:hypothetical protein
MQNVIETTCIDLDRVIVIGISGTVTSRTVIRCSPIQATFQVTGITLLPERVAAIKLHPEPYVERAKMTNFLGIINFYRRIESVQAAARTLKALTYALKGACSKWAPVMWTAEMMGAFWTAKEALPAATVLAHPQDKIGLVLMGDASVV